MLRKYNFILLLQLLFACGLGLTDSIEGESVTFSVVGDLMSHELQLKSAYDQTCRCYDYDPVFARVAPLLSGADLTIGNLETTLPGDPKHYSGYPAFGTPDSFVSTLKKSGFDILTTANNHSMDKGKKGLRRTIDVLNREGILHLGTYRSPSEHKSNRLLIVEKNGMRFALLNYTYGTNGIPVPDDVVVNLIEKGKISEDIDLARSMEPDAIIVLYHFGTEYLRFPDDFQKEMVAHAFHEGADIVLGGHPHVLQPFEIVTVTDRLGKSKKRLVIYSLGNFVSNQGRRYTDGGIIFNFRLTNEDSELQIEDVAYVPIWVYVEKKSHRVQFHILPTAQFLKNDSELILPDYAHKTMLTFHNDTLSHLRESLDSIQKITGLAGENERQN
jgi:poly-gamma-glutamate synthesis protein (capsule biosynthesis protein)